MCTPVLFERGLGEELLATFEMHRNATRLTANRRGGGGAPQDERIDDVELAALARALPLPLVLRVCRHVLAAPAHLEDERALVGALRRPSAGSPPDVALFRIAIRRAKAAGRALHLSRGASEGATGGGALALLRGDALVAPHYRLGVGVNHAFETLVHLQSLLRQLWGRGGRPALRDSTVAAALLSAWSESVGSDAAALAEYQLRVIYLEAACGLLVFGERVFARDRRRRALRELAADELRSLEC